MTCNNPFSFHLQVKRKITVRLGVQFLLYISSVTCSSAVENNQQVHNKIEKCHRHKNRIVIYCASSELHRLASVPRQKHL